jgi:hypothetical protein
MWTRLFMRKKIPQLDFGFSTIDKERERNPEDAAED